MSYTEDENNYYYDMPAIYIGEAGKTEGIEDWYFPDTDRENWPYYGTDNIPTFDGYDSRNDHGDKLYEQRGIFQVIVPKDPNLDSHYHPTTTFGTDRSPLDEEEPQASIVWNGQAEKIDSIADVSLEIRLTTGESDFTKMRFLQTENGHTFMLAFFPFMLFGGPDSDRDGFQNKPIASIRAIKGDIGGQSFLASYYVGPEFLAPCFTQNTLILTPDGWKAVNRLCAGDLVCTKDNGDKPIVWVGLKRVPAETLRTQPNIRPIVISKGALGHNIPYRDLIVSPQHRILVRSQIVQTMFNMGEVLVPAKALLVLDNVRMADPDMEVTYYHVMFDQHELVFSNGAETESLYPGPEALKAVGQDAMDEIYGLFPELLMRDFTPSKARKFIKCRKARGMASRHVKNGGHLVSSSP